MTTPSSFGSTNPSPPTPPPPPQLPAPPMPPAAMVPPLPPPTQRPPARGNSMLGCAFAISMLFNIGALLVLVIACMGVFFSRNIGGDGATTTSGGLIEKHYAGSSSDKEKVAIISFDGVIMEGTMAFVHKEIEQAAKDKNVKAIVLRINSPGGSITASDELHQRLLELRDGNTEKKYDPKPIIVSMGSLAASGGYYIAMPGKKIFAERTTLTGSIGVYAALPDVSGLAKEWKFGMRVIKAGEIKDSGSPFKEMSPKEERVWQDMINTAYLQFLDVVAKGRPKLTRAKMVERFMVEPILVGPDAAEQKAAPYQRYRADGGIYTAEKAKELDLIDAIGSEEDAIAEARKQAGLSESANVIQYEKPKTLSDILLGTRAPEPGLRMDPARLKNMLTPRMWYLAPGFDLTGMLATLEEGKP